MIKKIKIAKKLIILCLLCFVIGGAALAVTIAFFAISINVPDLTSTSERVVAQSTKIYDRTGKILIYDIHGEEKRTVIPFEEIPRHIKNATIALEDNTFYQHSGIRPFAIARAFFSNIISGSVQQGGSTITQQLIKNTYLTPVRTITRKIKEIALALKIERKYTKDEILNLYLNQIPYGSSAYGIEAASQTFFEKGASELTLREATYLASLPKAPSYYSPCGKHADRLAARADFALNRMKELGFIDDSEYRDAVNERVKFSGSCFQKIVAPHFVIEVRDILNERFGEDFVEKEGYKVTTTLNADIQKNAEDIVKKYSEQIKENFNANNISVVAIDPKTGSVLAMVGSKDYFGKSYPDGCAAGISCLFDPQVNVSIMKRQPGSAFKPFVYATAFKKGYTPETSIFDLFTEFSPVCNPNGVAPQGVDPKTCYHPQNYDEKFRGPVTLREALAQSLNVPSVKLLYLAGINKSISTAMDFGITTLNDPDRFGLTLVLGGGEVSLLELSSAYSAFANNGARNKYQFIKKIEDANNNIIYESESQTSQVIDTNIAKVINDILSDNNARSPVFGEFSSLYIPGKNVAAKTGTTNDHRDAWIVGYTPSITIGAWAGNNDNTPMKKKVAGFIIAPIWKEIMENALMNFPEEKFEKPDPFAETKPVLRGEWRGGKEFVIDKISSKLATEYTPQKFQERKVVQSIHSILYWLNKDDPLGNPPENPSSDPQFKNWENSVRFWATSQNISDKENDIIPKEKDDVHIPEYFPKIESIDLSPKKETYKTNEVLYIYPKITSKYDIKQVDYFIGEEYIGSVSKNPFSISINLSLINNLLGAGNFEMRLKIYDSVENQSEFIQNIQVE